MDASLPSMENSHFVRDKLTEWHLGQLIQKFEDEGISKETFLGLGNSGRLTELIPKIGPRVKLRKKLQEYLQTLKKANDVPRTMNTNSEQETPTEMDIELIPLCGNVAQGQLATKLFSLRHCLTAAMQGDFSALLKFLVPDLFAESNQVSSQLPKVSVVFYCNSCQSNMGNYHNSACLNSGETFDQASDIPNMHLFLYTSLKELLREVLKNQKELIPKRLNVTQDINDVMDGRMYQDLLKQGTLTEDDLTLTWNFDEVPIHNSSGRREYSVWPLQFTINELPFTHRKENVMVAGLWCSSERPKMDLFLKHFVDECCDLAENPLQWADSHGTVHSSRVFCLVCSSDAVARPILRNCTQFNGEYGCEWCLHPGTMVSKGNGSVRSYTYDQSKQTARSKKMFKQDAENDTDQSPKKGVKGLSPLLSLPLFDIVFGFVPEYMHSVVLGVSKQLLSLWLNPDYSEKSWYIGQYKSQMDSRLRSLKQPSEMSRPPLSICQGIWKAPQLRDFLLFYGVSVLNDLLQPAYLRHYLDLSFSVHILLQESISERDLQLARQCLVHFVVNMEELYGEEHVTFNCHQLIHLVDSVCNWGPLWATSAFGFEKNSKNLKALLKGTSDNPKHIYQRFEMWQHIPRHLDSLVFDRKENFGKLLAKLSPVQDDSNAQRRMAKTHRPNLSEPQKRAMEEFLNRPVVSSSVEASNEFTHQNTVYHCRQSDQSNCDVKLKNGSYGEIQMLLLLKENCVCISNCLCQATRLVGVHLYDIKPHPLFGEKCSDKPVFVKAGTTSNFKVFHVKDIACKCVNMDGWLVPLPNTCEKY